MLNARFFSVPNVMLESVTLQLAHCNAQFSSLYNVKLESETLQLAHCNAWFSSLTNEMRNVTLQANAPDEVAPLKLHELLCLI